MQTEAQGSAIPEWILLLPVGRVELVDGRPPLEVDQEALAAILATYEARGVDLVIDYEHQSLTGAKAPAAGWIKELKAREDGLWARVEWTAQAREFLGQREYRYFSPVLRLEAQSRRPTALLQVALTNVPAIQGLAPLVAKYEGVKGKKRKGGKGDQAVYLLCRVSEEEQGVPLAASNERKEKNDMWEALREKLGLAPETGEESLLASVQELLRELALTLNLPEEASAGQVKGGLAALKAGAERGPALEQELSRLKTQLAEETTARAVDEALRAGKISPAQKTWAWEYCRRDPEGFQTYVAQAPPLVPVGTQLTWLKEEEGTLGLTPADLEICRQLNITPAQFRAAQERINQIN
ncbi:MAG: phage protease [Thermodesulfobacteriota bacterium]